MLDRRVEDALELGLTHEPDYLEEAFVGEQLYADVDLRLDWVDRIAQYVRTVVVQ